MKFMFFLWRLWAGISAVAICGGLIVLLVAGEPLELFIILGGAAAAAVPLAILHWAAGAFTGDRYH